MTESAPETTSESSSVDTSAVSDTTNSDDTDLVLLLETTLGEHRLTKQLCGPSGLLSEFGVIRRLRSGTRTDPGDGTTVNGYIELLPTQPVETELSDLDDVLHRCGVDQSDSVDDTYISTLTLQRVIDYRVEPDRYRAYAVRNPLGRVSPT